jgi:hypothetical protein
MSQSLSRPMTRPLAVAYSFPNATHPDRKFTVTTALLISGDQIHATTYDRAAYLGCYKKVVLLFTQAHDPVTTMQRMVR